MSGRRGVHHSGGLRAKRRWLRWRRYQERCDALVGGQRLSFGRRVCAGPMLDGYVMAHARASYVGRYPPIGIRDVRP